MKIIKLIILCFFAMAAVHVMAQRKITIQASPVDEAYHTWKVTEIELYDDKTIVKKTITAKTAYVQASSYRNAYIQDDDTGIKYYIKASSLGLKGIKTKLTDKNPHEVVETYEPLPQNVTHISINANNKFLCSNLNLSTGETKPVSQPRRNRVIAQEQTRQNNRQDNISPTTKTNPTVEKAKATAVQWIDQPLITGRKADENLFALVIANEDYKHAGKVAYAIRDGQAVRDYLKKTVGISDENLHFVQNATGNDIKYQIKWLQDIIAAYKGQASIILYYSGHGIPDETTAQAAILPVDGYAEDFSTANSLNDIYDALAKYPSQQALVILDACFSGTLRDGKNLTQARGVALKAKPGTVKGNLVVLAAAKGEQTAYAYDKQQHGLFTYYLLKAIKDNKGDISLGQLADNITDQVTKASIRVNGKIQTPTIQAATTIGNEWRKWKF